MSTQLSSEQIERIVAFHGHWCPGLAWGIRVSEAALRELGPRAPDEEIVAVTETDNCAVDAIQYMVGCTAGKGNLVILDHGQNAFTFVRRSDGRAIRISRKVALPNTAQQPGSQEALAAREGAREDLIRETMMADEADLLELQELEDYRAPERAQVLASVRCDSCGQPTMASKLVCLEDKRLCLSCVQTELTSGVHMNPIGVAHNDLRPGQAPPRARSPRSIIEVRPEFAAGLLGIEANSHLQVLFLFAQSKDVPLQQHRYGDPSEPLRGVFALRTPRRLNRIGLTTVRLLSVEGNRLCVEGLDAWDGTPVLDIKPHAPRLDEGSAG